MTKRCTECGEPTTDFPVSYKSKAGTVFYKTICKPCANKQARERYRKSRLDAGKDYTPYDEERHQPREAAIYTECRPSGCVFFAVCRAQIWDASFDPYCFAGGWRYELFVKEYAAVV